MDGTCIKDGRDETHKIFWLENLNGREHLECLSVNRKIILK